MLKRAMDLVISALLLCLLAVPMILIGVCIRLETPGPAIFRQKRVGRRGTEFDILKFRTMRLAAAGEVRQITVGNDARITALGRYLRRFKIDELPQLVNVARGDMSLVGPRPEVPRYVAHYPPGIRDIVLSVRPGITDPASIRFRNESDLLSKFDDPEAGYVETILPMKLNYYVDYVHNQSLLLDLNIALRTIAAVLIPSKSET